MALEEFGRAGGLVVAQHAGRRFPGVLIQGDTLFTLYEDLAEEAPNSYALDRVGDWLAGYEGAMDELGLDLPYPKTARVTPQHPLMSVGDPQLRASLRSRLGQLAGMVALGRHLDAMDQATPLACDLLVADIALPGVIATAGLTPGTTWRDGRDVVLAMLDDLGYTVEEPSSPDDEWPILLRAFAYWELPPEQFIGPFLHRVPDVEHQTDLDRELLLLFDEFDHETEPAGRAAIVDRMRRAVRAYPPDFGES